jgi:hypothetical protein
MKTFSLAEPAEFAEKKRNSNQGSGFRNKAPETSFFPSPSTGEGEGGGDWASDFQIFLFLSTAH